MRTAFYKRLFWMLFLFSLPMDSAAIERTALLKKEHPLSFTTSIIIPCAAKHFPYISELLEHYAAQTLLPDEIIISLSESTSIENGAIEQIQKKTWPFTLRIYAHENKRSEGENRNLGTLYSSGDLLIYQDADDLPHPERVEILKTLFDTYHIDHLLHTYVLDVHFTGFQSRSLDQLDVFYSQTLTNCIGENHFHNGAVAMTRELAKKIKWVEGFVISTDTLTHMEVYKTSAHKVFLLEPLILYRYNLSSYHGASQ